MDQTISQLKTMKEKLIDEIQQRKEALHTLDIAIGALEGKNTILKIPARQTVLRTLILFFQEKGTITFDRQDLMNFLKSNSSHIKTSISTHITSVLGKGKDSGYIQRTGKKYKKRNKFEFTQVFINKYSNPQSM